MAAVTLTGTDVKIIVWQHNSFGKGVQQVLKNLKQFAYRVLLARADGFLSVSAGMAEDMAAACGIPRSRVSVIHNPIINQRFWSDLHLPVSHPFLAQNGPPVFLAVARLVPQKDFTTLLTAFTIYRRTHQGR